MTREAVLHKFAANNSEAAIDYEFFSESSLDADYLPFLEYISSKTKEEVTSFEEMWTSELIEYSKEYINEKIQKDDVKHGDIFWMPAWGSAGWSSFRVNGIHHVIEYELGVKKLYGGIYTEGMPVGDPSDYPDVTYDTVYQELNELTGYQYSFKNAWYKWYKGMGTD